MLAEIKDVRGEIKNTFDLASSDGFDKKIMRAVIKLRTLPEDKRLEVEALIDTYMSQLSSGQKP